MSSRVRCSASSLFEEVASGGSDSASSTSGWVEEWVEKGQRIDAACSAALTAWNTLTEAHVASVIGLHTPSDIPIIASSSMPIRDLDTFTSVRRSGRVLANRGINGIDGVVSTSIGVVRSSATKRSVVHIGDVAALHDVGGILDAARQGVDLTIVIPNNDGGGIFSFLPAKTTLEDSQFTSLFHTPHGTTFDFLGGHDDIHHELVTSGQATDVGSAIERSFTKPGVSIIEIPVSTAERLEFRDALSERLHSS
jgi:2-succinyl-5-enolpyruvyl-6-hydroxy-3-cyclohexene-1-carboxylate synthase